jgi:hypothetical protein
MVYAYIEHTVPYCIAEGMACPIANNYLHFSIANGTVHRPTQRIDIHIGDRAYDATQWRRLTVYSTV